MKFGWLKAFLALSLLANLILFLFLGSAKVSNDEAEANKMPYLSPRIFAHNINDLLLNFVPLRSSLKDYVSKQKDPLSLYFEYLPTGISIGVNEKEEIRLASLSKLPVVMAVFKEIEEGRMSLSDTLVLKKEYLDPSFGELYKRGEGAKISVEEAIKLTLQESDNTSQLALLDKLGSAGQVPEVYNYLDVQLDKSNGFPLVTAKSFSSMFKSLYLSSFLTKENSNKILEIMTESIFNDRIPAGVPNEVKVAHKIGTFGTRTPEKNHYSDCGIVYVPKRPYVLCIFAQTSKEKVTGYMKDISSQIYNYVSEVKAE